MRESDWRRLDLHATGAASHGIVDLRDLDEMGVPRSTVSRWRGADRLVRLAPRTYLVPGLLDDLSPYAALLRSMPEAVASHRCAAWLLGLDGVDEERVEVTVPHGRRPRRRGHLIHRSTDLLPFEVVEVAGLPCTDATRTLCDLGAVVDESILERALEAALRGGLTSVPRLRWRSGQLRRQGRAGPGALRRVLDRRPARTAPTGSDLESRFVQCLREAGLPDPVRQHGVRLPGGQRARLDLAYPEAMLFVELDGDASHATRTARTNDRIRQTALVTLGWRPIRLGWSEVVHTPEAAVATVRAALELKPP